MCGVDRYSSVNCTHQEFNAEDVSVIKKFDEGEDIFKEGDVGTEAYLIKSGHVSISRMSKGEKVHLAVKCEGEIVGEMSLLDETECSATVTASSPVELEVITKANLEELLADAPEMLATIMHQLMESLRSSNDLLSMYSAQLDEMA